MAVRCRYDETAERSFKTVELIIEQADWTPPTERAEPSPEHVVPVHTVIGIRVDLHETELQSKVEKAGGAWNRQKKLWEIEYQHVERLGLKGRAVQF